jgi:flagellin-specific chaperone FliS
MDKIKADYNALLERQKKAAKWMDEATEEEQEKHLRRYQSILLELSNLMKVMDDMRIDYTTIDILEGFQASEEAA